MAQLAPATAFLHPQDADEMDRKYQGDYPSNILSDGFPVPKLNGHFQRIGNLSERPVYAKVNPDGSGANVCLWNFMDIWTITKLTDLGNANIYARSKDKGKDPSKLKEKWKVYHNGAFSYFKAAGFKSTSVRAIPKSGKVIPEDAEMPPLGLEHAASAASPPAKLFQPTSPNAPPPQKSADSGLATAPSETRSTALILPNASAPSEDRAPSPAPTEKTFTKGTLVRVISKSEKHEPFANKIGVVRGTSKDGDGYKVVFFHCFDSNNPTIWSDDQLELYEKIDLNDIVVKDAQRLSNRSDASSTVTPSVKGSESGAAMDPDGGVLVDDPALDIGQEELKVDEDEALERKNRARAASTQVYHANSAPTSPIDALLMQDTIVQLDLQGERRRGASLVDFIRPPHPDESDGVVREGKLLKRGGRQGKLVRKTQTRNCRLDVNGKFTYFDGKKKKGEQPQFLSRGVRLDMSQDLTIEVTTYEPPKAPTKKSTQNGPLPVPPKSTKDDRIWSFQPVLHKKKLNEKGETPLQDAFAWSLAFGHFSVLEKSSKYLKVDGFGLHDMDVKPENAEPAWVAHMKPAHRSQIREASCESGLKRVKTELNLSPERAAELAEWKRGDKVNLHGLNGIWVNTGVIVVFKHEITDREMKRYMYRSPDLRWEHILWYSPHEHNWVIAPRLDPTHYIARTKNSDVMFPSDLRKGTIWEIVDPKTQAKLTDCDTISCEMYNELAQSVRMPRSSKLLRGLSTKRTPK